MKMMRLETFEDLCGDFMLIEVSEGRVVSARVEWGGDWLDKDHNPAPDEIQIYNGVCVSDSDIGNDDLEIFMPDIKVQDNTIALTSAQTLASSSFVFAKWAQGEFKTIKLLPYIFDNGEK